MKKSSFLASAAGLAGVSFSLDTPPSVFYKIINRPTGNYNPRTKVPVI